MRAVFRRRDSVQPRTASTTPMSKPGMARIRVIERPACANRSRYSFPVRSRPPGIASIFMSAIAIRRLAGLDSIFSDINDFAELREIISRNQRLGDPPGIFRHGSIEDDGLIGICGQIFECPHSVDATSPGFAGFYAVKQFSPRAPGPLAAKHQCKV